MRYLRLFIAILVLQIAASSAAKAALVSLTLAAADANTNRLAITLPTVNGFAETDLSGIIQADIAIDAAGVITQLTLLGGPLSGTDWSTPSSIGVINGESIGGILTTPTPPGSVAAGSFTASQHTLSLNTGKIFVAGAEVEDFSPPFPMIGDGTGTLTSTSAGPGLFDIAFTLNINTTDTLGGGPPVSIVGTLVASGQVAVPEPASGMLLGVSAIALCVRRRGYRRQAYF